MKKNEGLFPLNFVIFASNVCTFWVRIYVFMQFKSVVILRVCDVFVMMQWITCFIAIIYDGLFLSKLLRCIFFYYYFVLYYYKIKLSHWRYIFLIFNEQHFYRMPHWIEKTASSLRHERESKRFFALSIVYRPFHLMVFYILVFCIIIII